MVDGGGHISMDKNSGKTCRILHTDRKLYSAPTVGLMWMFMYYRSGGHLVAKSQKNLCSLVSVQTSSDSQLKTVASSVI